jgi:hypothetical protein
MANNTACSPTGTCVIMSGSLTNGTDFVAQYDPSVPVPHWRVRMELATIVVCNSLSRKPIFMFIFVVVAIFAILCNDSNLVSDLYLVIVIVSRIAYRWRKLRRFRGDDRWMAGAAVSL